jgi:acyl carrier protein
VFTGPLLSVPSEYTVTDLSPLLVNQAKANLAGFDFIEYGVLDIEQDPVAQGYHEHGYDGVIVSNVLHGVSEPVGALRRIKRLLKPGGHVVMAEGTAPSMFQLVGLAFVELAGRPDGNRGRSLLTVPDSQSELVTAGFTATAAFPQRAVPVRVLAQQVLLGRGPDAVDHLRTDDLRAHVSRTLPGHMLPAVFLRHDALPLTANGKVDRGRLPKPPPPAVRPDDGAAPANAVERALAAVWAELLQVDAVTRQDNFFAHGGDSLMAVRLIARVRAELGAELTMRDLFACQRLADLAVLIDERTVAGRGKDTA